MIGATALSNKARSLEMACIVGDTDYIQENTGKVLAYYRSYLKKIKDL